MFHIYLVVAVKGWFRCTRHQAPKAAEIETEAVSYSILLRLYQFFLLHGIEHGIRVITKKDCTEPGYEMHVTCGWMDKYKDGQVPHPPVFRSFPWVHPHSTFDSNPPIPALSYPVMCYLVPFYFPFQPTLSCTFLPRHVLLSPHSTFHFNPPFLALSYRPCAP